MINSKDEYLYYVKADRIAKALPFSNNQTLFYRIKRIFFPNYIWEFQKALRKLEYYSNCKNSIIHILTIYLVKRRYNKLSLKLGFSIPINVFGPGLSIAHKGTIIVNSGVRIGANCRLHACVNIGTEAGYGSRAPKIGDNCYIGPGVKMYGKITLKDGISIGANSVVNKTIYESGVAIAGVPAKVIKDFDSTDILIPATKILDSNIYSNEFVGQSAKQLKKYYK